MTFHHLTRDFLGGSDSKESACSVGHLGSIRGLGRSPREGNGYPLQCSGLENPTGCVVHGVTWPGESHGLCSPRGHMAWRIPRAAQSTGSHGLENPTGCTVHSITKSRHNRATFAFRFQLIYFCLCFLCLRRQMNTYIYANMCIYICLQLGLPRWHYW